MYYIKDFCRVCLRSEISMQDVKKNLNDENSDTLINKLQTCITEVEWSMMRHILICNSCVDRLNAAYEFKRQCLTTTKILESYTVQLEKSNSEPKNFKVQVSRKDVGQEIIDKYLKQQAQKTNTEGKLQEALQVKPTVTRFLPALPSLIVAPNNNNNNNQNQNTFQNIFLNLIPSTNVKATPKEKNPKNVKTTPKNNSVYMNINNAYHKVFPLTPTESTTILSQISAVPETTSLSNGTVQTEELSVEIDPSMFDCTPEVEIIPDDEGNDWEDLISSSKICPATVTPTTSDKNNSLQLPNEVQPNLEDYFNIDHFMALKETNSKVAPKTFPCVQCGKISDTFKALIDHISQVHSGKFPYTCNDCSATFAVSSHYESHIQEHARFFSNPLHKDMLTLEDVSVQNEAVLFPKIILSEDDDPDYEVKIIDSVSFPRFKRESKKKYFIKGVKNAKCPICQREFSTQSYMQSHMKLHYRKSDHRHKVHGESNKMSSPLEIDFENEISKSEIIIENGVKPLEPVATSNLRTLLEGKNLKETDDREEIMDDCEEIVSEPVSQFQNSELVEDGLNLLSDVSADNSMDCDVHLGESDPIKEEELPNERRPPYLQLTTENGKPQCNICFKVFSRRHDLKRHMNNIHLKTIQYTCHLCNSYFYEAFHLTRHLRIHVGFVKCTICFKDFSAVRDLKFHIMGSHDNCASGQCGMCGQHFQRIKHLREHMQEHENSILYKCHICGDEFRESRELTRHLVGHSGMYSCSLCATTLSNEHELSNHMKCHNEFTQTERKYACSFCSNRYKEKRYLNLHMRNVHPVEYENI